MNRAFSSFILSTLLLFTGCESSTKYGACVGLDDEDRRDPHLIYDVSVWNAFMGVIFIETIIAPALVLFDELYCPVGEKAK